VTPIKLPPEAPTPPLDPDVRRWLHDKYERLAAEEGQLAASRTSYFAAIGTVLITALVVVINYFLNQHGLLLVLVTFVSGLGFLISFVWLILLHRTIDAMKMWRESAANLERLSPPVDGVMPAPVTLRSGGTIEVDLLRPYIAHAQRFSKDHAISWPDRLSPDFLTEILPMSFLVIWTVVLVAVWVYFGL